jgi:hypothetical protein
MILRHELKYVTTPTKAKALQQSLKALMQLDPNSDDTGSYRIISLYFDTVDGAAFFDKLNGIEYRRKYRIRTYNDDWRFFKLECKYKLQDWTAKESETVPAGWVNALCQGQDLDIPEGAGPLMRRFMMERRSGNLIPAVIIEYQRTAYVMDALDVRVTFDERIQMDGYTTDMFATDRPRVPLLEAEVVVEVKYNEVLPASIAAVLRPITMQRLAISKYAFGYNKK